MTGDLNETRKLNSFRFIGASKSRSFIVGGFTLPWWPNLRRPYRPVGWQMDHDRLGGVVLVFSSINLHNQGAYPPVTR